MEELFKSKHITNKVDGVMFKGPLVFRNTKFNIKKLVFHLKQFIVTLL